MAQKLSGFDLIKFLLAVAGGAAGGLLLIFGPADMREEIPFHVEIGLGVLAFAALMIAALFSVRAKALLITIISGLVAAGVLFVVAFADDWPLWQRAVFGLLGAGSALFAIFSLISFFRGEDPAD
ncbi:MAG: hypothetical protein RLN72_01785 [Henriciella sp.]